MKCNIDVQSLFMFRALERFVFKEFLKGYAERVGKCLNIFEADVALAELDRADIGPVETGEFCQLLLG